MADVVSVFLSDVFEIKAFVVTADFYQPLLVVRVDAFCHTEPLLSKKTFKKPQNNHINYTTIALFLSIPNLAK